MDNENPRFERPLYFSILKGLGIGVATVVLKLVVSLSVWQNYAVSSMFGEFENFAIYIVSFVCSLFVYNSVIGISMTFDVFARDEVMTRTYDRTGAIPSFKDIFLYKSFLAETATTVLVLFIASLCGSTPEIFGMFHLGEGRSPYEAGIFPALVTLPIILFLCFFARFEAVRYWKYLYRTANLELIESKLKLAFRIAFIVILYPIALPYIPIIFFVVWAIIGLIGSIAVSMTIPVFCITVLLILFALWCLKILLAIRKRNKFFNKMKESAAKMGFTVTPIKNTCSSLITRKRKCTFSLIRGKEIYDCLVIGHPRYRVPVCFTSETKGHYRHRIGTPKHNITFETKFDYSLDSQNKKLLIIAPTPKHAYICDGGKEKRLFTADKLWDFVVYESDGFIGSLERDCLGRYS